MRLTAVLFRASKKSNAPIRSIKSLALSVYFKQPDLGVKDYEILSRASAFLLAVDPPEVETKEGPYGHLEKNEQDRKLKLHKQNKKYTPVGGPERELKDLGWLEFAPREVRPTVHVVCSSHVLAPFLWKNYYQQDWLKKVKQDHCIYSLDVFDPLTPGESLGKFALNPYPIHHPEERDLAFIHLKQEEESLEIMKGLGVEVLHLRDLEGIYEKGDQVTFDGYVVAESDAANQERDTNATDETRDGSPQEEVEDNRVFLPYQETGKLAFHTRDRFFATTPKPLPEGLCGGPVLDKDGMVCGVVEGIVAKDHSNKDIAGSAAFMPNYVMTPFIEFAERFMLQKVLSRDLFQQAVTAKTTNRLGGGVFQKQEDGRYSASTTASWEEAYDRAVEQLKKNHSKEEVAAILGTIARERKEAMKILDSEGGDMTEILERVRRRTLDVRQQIHEEYMKEMKENPTTSKDN